MKPRYYSKNVTHNFVESIEGSTDMSKVKKQS